MMMQVVGGWGGGRWGGGGGGRWGGVGGVGGGGLPPLPTHPPLRFTREQTRVEYIRRCRLMNNIISPILPCSVHILVLFHCLGVYSRHVYHIAIIEI